MNTTTARLTLLACLLLTMPVLAQETTGSIEGTVTDRTSGAIAAARVVAVNVEEIQGVDAQRGRKPRHEPGSRTLESRLPDPDAHRTGELQFRGQFFSAQADGLTSSLQAVTSKQRPRHGSSPSPDRWIPAP